MKNKLLFLSIILIVQGCTFDSESRMQYRFGQYVGQKFDVYKFVDMSAQECLKQREIRRYQRQHGLNYGFEIRPWNPLNRENCGIHKVGETPKTADYEITYYGTCKYIYTVDKKTDIILGWRYTKDSKNCVPGP